MAKTLQIERPTLGVCYYPEHWDRTLWRDDLARMKELGITHVRIAEFAWTVFEPEDGVFSFDLFDDFLELAQEAGMLVIFGTPTATPPAWLSRKYPEILNRFPDGGTMYHGARRHYTYNSEVYRFYTERIVDQLAAHYCPHPSIVGWQIDNEFNCGINNFYADADHRAFRTFLREKYGALEHLNECWGTVFWSQTYMDWEEIFLPRDPARVSPNPHLALDAKRFFSASAISYCKLQADVIQRHNRRQQFITTNGLFGHLDNSEMTETCLDFITYDSYPNFAFQAGRMDTDSALRDRKWSMHLTRARAVSPVFGIMEQQSGPGGWVSGMYSTSPKPGQLRLWSLQSLAHGADFVSYFRWRTATFGTEIYWHGLLNYDNLPNRRTQELSLVRDDFAKLERVAGARYEARVALVENYDNEWDGEFDVWHGPLLKQSTLNWCEALQYSHTPFDVINFEERPNLQTKLDDLNRYDLLICPHATVITQAAAELLTEYVRQGGKIIFGARSGYKDEFGRCRMTPMPCVLSELCGVRVEDFTARGPLDGPVTINLDGAAHDTLQFCDILDPLPGAEVLAHFAGDYYDGRAALVSRKVGDGTAYYWGSGFTVGAARALIGKLGLSTPYRELITLPETCEVAVRDRGGERTMFVLNYEKTEAALTLSRPLPECLSGETLQGQVTLPPYGVMAFAL